MGRTLAMHLTDGSEHEVEIVQTPFFDSKKNIVRGLDRSIPKRPAI
jgi:aminomethyltransferase